MYAALAAITFVASIVTGAIGYGFSSITVPLALLGVALGIPMGASLIRRVVADGPAEVGRAFAVLATARAPAFTCSFQAEDVVVLDMLRRVRPDIPVLFLDTVHHFEETCRYRDELAERWNLNLVTLRAPEPQPGLWQTSTDACCALHKVGPLFAALEAYDLWFTGLRREQSPSRAALRELESFRLPSGRSIVKISPLAAWTMAEVQDYARQQAIPLLRLYEAGYVSIGCEPAPGFRWTRRIRGQAAGMATSWNAGSTSSRPPRSNAEGCGSAERLRGLAGGRAVAALRVRLRLKAFDDLLAEPGHRLRFEGEKCAPLSLGQRQAQNAGYGVDTFVRWTHVDDHKATRCPWLMQPAHSNDGVR